MSKFNFGESVFGYAVFDKTTQGYVGYEDGVVECDGATTVLYTTHKEAAELKKDLEEGAFLSGKKLKNHTFEIHKFRIIQCIGSRIGY